MNDVLAQLGKTGIVPVVALDDVASAEPLGQALMEGGLPCAEITFRTEAAEESIRRMSAAFPGMTVGAGTVLSIDQVDRAVEAGAKFIVSPGTNPEVVKYCVKNDIPVTPGIVTPTEIELALSCGVDVVKFFPAEPSGGLAMIKALAAPYVNVKFMPTGGVSQHNVRDYLKYDRIFACGGTWMVKKDLINSGRFDEIKRLTTEAAQIVREIR